MDNLDAHQIITQSLHEYTSYVKQAGDTLMVKCPFHGDTDPSCGIYMAHGMEIPLGMFNCFGCGIKGHWNKFAKQIGAPEIAGWQTNENTTDDFMRNLRKVDESVMGTGNLTLKGLMRSMGNPAHIAWCKDTDWRNYPGRLINKVGGRFLIQEQGRSELMLFLPIKISGVYQGGVKAYMNKMPNRLSYVNTAGTWIRDYGIFPYEFTKQMVQKFNYNFVVLVEGPRDALRLLMQGIPAVAVLGAKNFSDKKLFILMAMGISNVYTLGDNDEGGETMRGFIDESCDNLSVKCNHLRLPEEHRKDDSLIKLDPDDCGIEIITEVRKYLKSNERIHRMPKFVGHKQFEAQKNK